MPKANLRQVAGGAPFQDFVCTVCKARTSIKCESPADEKVVAAHKAAIFKEWDAHLYAAHRRQWDAQQAKREAKKQRS